MTPHWKEVSDPAIIAAKPLVSVAMLAYNHSAFIAEAIEGVVMQKTQFPIELVIGVDQSPDNTLEIVLHYQKLHPKLIRVLIPEQRLGMHKNCFLTLQACRGKYLAMCEGDDFWIDPGKVAKQVAVLEENSALAGCFHDCYMLNQKTGLRKLRMGDRKIDTRPNTASLIREKNITTCSMLFRNCISFPELAQLTRNIVQIDYMICLLVSEHGPWQYLPHPMALYRFHDGGIWGGCSAAERWRQDENFYRALIASGKFASHRSLVQSAARNQRWFLSLVLAREGKLLSSLYHYARSIGPKGFLPNSHANPVNYGRVLVRAASVRLGIEGPAVRLWHKLAGQKARSL